jgi:hypothetical protein
VRIGVIGPDGGPRYPNFGKPSSAYPARRFQRNLEFKIQPAACHFQR